MEERVETTSEKLRRVNREKRKKRVDAAEAARPEAERYRNRTDFNDFVHKQLSKAREQVLRYEKAMFIEFAVDSNVV